MKERLEPGNFSGQSFLSVYQDFHAKVFAKNLTVIITSPDQEAVKHEYEGKKTCVSNKYDAGLFQIQRYVIFAF